MGKRTRRRNEISTSKNCTQDPLNEVKFTFTSMEPCYPEQTSEPLRVLKQVKDCINEIYSEHINDLEQRKQKRLECKIPTDFFFPYNLVVNLSYQQRIRNQIQDLKRYEFDAVFKDSLLSSTDIFVDYLKKHVNEFDGKKGLLQVIILYEAYHTLQNSITQIGAIIEDVLPRYRFEMILKTMFLTKVASAYYELIDVVAKKEHSEYVEDLLRMKSELDNISSTSESDKQMCIQYCPTLCSESCSDEDINIEALHNLPIDELVKIITQDEKKKKKRNNNNQDKSKIKTNQMRCNGKKLKSKSDNTNSKGVKPRRSISTKDNSVSPNRESSEYDEEIENFKQRLELEKPSPVRVQPSVSEELRAKWKEQLRRSRVYS